MATLYEQYAQPATSFFGGMANQPLPSDLWDYNKVWGGFRNPVQELAAQQINPEVTRQYRQNLRGIQSNLGSQGGFRFGAGRGQIGSLKAQSERDRIAQIGDWENWFRTGVYDPLYQSAYGNFQRALSSGLKPSRVISVPRWEDLFDKYNQMYGNVAQVSSPFYG